MLGVWYWCRMPYQGIDYANKLTMAYYIGIPLIIAWVLGVAIFSPRLATPEPISSKAYGCYANDLAPPILLNADGMKILQDGFPPIGYRLERHKQGITLTVEAPITASQKEAKYAYSIDSRGIGRFLSFYREIDGRRYGVFDEANLDRFKMLADDGMDLLYVRGPASLCGST